MHLKQDTKVYDLHVVHSLPTVKSIKLVLFPVPETNVWLNRLIVSTWKWWGRKVIVGHESHFPSQEQKQQRATINKSNFIAMLTIWTRANDTKFHKQSVKLYMYMEYNTWLLFMKIMNKSTNLWSVCLLAMNKCEWKHACMNTVNGVHFGLGKYWHCNRYSYNKQNAHNLGTAILRRQLCMQPDSFIQLAFVHSAHTKNERSEKIKEKHRISFVWKREKKKQLKRLRYTNASNDGARREKE